MAAGSTRKKDRNDIPKQILMSWDLCKRSEQRADELDKPYSRYVRDLIIADLKCAADERLSQQRAANSTGNPVQNPNSPFGLLEGISKEELAEFINFFRKLK